MAETIRPDTLFRTAGAAYMREQNARLLKNLPGTLSGEDPGALHDLRVATRRLRAALRVFERCLEPDEYRAWYRHISRVTSALGAVRDMDVQRDALERRRAGLSDELQTDVAAWLSERDTEREAERKAMARVLTRWQDERRSQAFERVLQRMERPGRLRASIAEVQAFLRESASHE